MDTPEHISNWHTVQNALHQFYKPQQIHFKQNDDGKTTK